MSEPTVSMEEARQRRIAELESSLRHPKAPGVRPLTSVLGLCAVAVLLFLQRGELAYVVSPKEPLQLGFEGAYAFDRLVSNRYVEIHGVPTLRGAYERDGDRVHVVIGLRDTPVLVRRGALPGETWAVGQVPPQPDQRPFSVRGRLLAEADAPRYADGFRRLREMGEVQPLQGQLWIVLESQRPGADAGLLVAAGALAAFAVLNVWLLARALLERRARRAVPG